MTDSPLPTPTPAAEVTPTPTAAPVVEATPLPELLTSPLPTPAVLLSPLAAPAAPLVSPLLTPAPPLTATAAAGVSLLSTDPNEKGWQLTYNPPGVALATGAATYHYPLEVPPGRQGLQPALNLSYNSQRLDGVRGWIQDWVGVGWTLDTLDIVRQGAGFTGEDGSTVISIKSLLLLNGTAYQLIPAAGVTEGLPGRYYVQDAPAIYVEMLYDETLLAQGAQPYYWRVRIQGVTYTVGNTANSQQTLSLVQPQSPVDSAIPVYRWRWQTAQDTYGNRMQANYYEPAVDCNGREWASLLDTIQYNNLSSGWYTEIRFIRSTQYPPASPGSLGEDANKHAWFCNHVMFGDPGALDRIEVRQASQLWRTYQLTIGMDPNPWQNETIRRRLYAIQPVAADGQQLLPATQFTYAYYPNQEVVGEDFNYPRLVAVTNGYGAWVGFTYQGVSDPHRTEILYSYRVQTQQQRDGVRAATAVLSYTYGPAYYKDGSLQGYDEVTVREYDYSVTGTPLQTTRHAFHNTPDASGDALRGREYRTQVYSGTQLLQQVETQWMTSTVGTTYFVHADQITTTLVNGGVTTTTRVDYTYDAYGNVLVEAHQGNLALVGDELFIERTFLVTATATAWIVDRPAWERRGSQETTYAYDDQPAGRPPLRGALTRVVQGTEALTTSTAYGYDAWGHRTVVTDTLGRVSRTEYDALYHLYAVRTVNPLGQAVTTTWSLTLGVPLVVTDVTGAATRYAYDPFGRLTAVYGPDPATGQPAATADLTYTYPLLVAGQLTVTAPFSIAVARRAQPTNWTCYDGLGRALQTQTAAGSGQLVVQSTGYDARGRVLTQTLPATRTATGGVYQAPQWTAANATVTAYDALDRPVQVRGPDGTTTRTAYRGWQTAVLDANGHQVITEQDGLGQTRAISECTGFYTQPDWTAPAAVTRYWYTAAGQLAAVQDAAGDVTRLEYDALGRKVGLWDPSMGHWQYVYDPAGRLTAQTDALGQVTQFTYDALDRPLTRPAGSGVVTTTYGTQGWATGRRVAMTDSTGLTTWGYDARGQVLTETRALAGGLGTYQTAWTYDAAGRPLTVRLPTGEVVTTTYDARGLVQGLSGWTPYLTGASYTAAGQPASLVWGNGLTTTYTYQPQNLRLLQLQVSGDRLTLQYAYDPVGNVTRLTDTTRSEVTLYAYDERDRLLSARGPLTESYAYNAVGNLLALTPTVGTAARYTYGLSQTVLFTATVPPTLTHQAFLPLVARYWAPGPAYPAAPAYPTTGQPFAVLSTTAGFRATYDAHGNMTQRVEVSGTQRITYTQEWDAGHRLAVVTATVGGVTRFSYDGDDTRVQQVNANGTTLYLGAVELFITGTTRITKTYYALGSQPVALRVVSATTNTVYWLHGDALGSLVLVTASAGPGTAQRYTPYGTLRVGGGLPTDLGFTGQRADGTGLMFYQARYYSPGLGRFISADTLIPEPDNPQSFNRYSYVLGNPLKYTDPSGHDLMIVGGIGGDFKPATWKEWIQAYTGWDEKTWDDIAAQWEELYEMDDLGAINELLSPHGIRIFTWGSNNASVARSVAAKGFNGVSMVETLSQELSEMEDITLLGWSKGANLVNFYLKQLSEGADLTRPLHAVLIGQPNFSEVNYPIPFGFSGRWAGYWANGLNPLINENVPRFSDVNVAWICGVKDPLCAGSSRNAINYGAEWGISGHGPHGNIARQVLSDLQVAHDSNAFWEGYRQR